MRFKCYNHKYIQKWSAHWKFKDWAAEKSYNLTHSTILNTFPEAVMVRLDTRKSRHPNIEHIVSGRKWQTIKNASTMFLRREGNLVLCYLVFVFISLGLVLNKSTNVRGVAFQRKYILNKSMYHCISSLWHVVKHLIRSAKQIYYYYYSKFEYKEGQYISHIAL